MTAVGQGSMARATIHIMEATSSTPTGGSGASMGQVHFRFNPETYKITKTAEWEAKKTQAAGNAPAPAFKGTSPRDLTVQMFLDETDDGTGATHNVKDAIERLMECCSPTVRSGEEDKYRPPYVQFQWGTYVSFHAYVKSVTATYLLFDGQGKPLRATVDLTMSEAPRVPGGQNPTSGALAAHRERTMSAGDSLASLAYAEYGDPTLWRAIAEANDIDDPMRPRPGDRLLIPSLSEAQERR